MTGLDNLIANRPASISLAQAHAELRYAEQIIRDAASRDTPSPNILDLHDEPPLTHLTQVTLSQLPIETLKAILANKLNREDLYQKIETIIPFIDLLDLANRIKTGEINIEDIDEAIDQLE